MLIYFVRHGETDWNLQGRMMGEHDIPLNENGRQLARYTAEGLREVPFDLAITSPLSRARETAQLIVGERDIPIRLEPRIREIAWGEWDGLTRQELAERGDEEKYEFFYHSPMQFEGGPGGESIRQVCERTGEFYEELIHNPKFQDKTILVVTHGCAVRGILNSLYEDREDFWHGGVPANCAVNIVEVHDGAGRFLEEDRIFYDPALCKNYYVGKSAAVEENA